MIDHAINELKDDREDLLEYILEVRQTLNY